MDFYAFAVMVGTFVATTVYGTQFLKDRTGLYDRFLANRWAPVRLLMIVLLAAVFWVVVILLVLLVMFLVVKLGHAITDAAAEP